MRISVVLLAIGIAWSLPVAFTEAGSLTPSDLRCEYLRDPLGIDLVRPRLSWQLVSNAPEARGQAQTAYQIVVASSEEALKADRGDLWDTGKVESDRSQHVAYQGRALQSEQACWWKVRVWDQEGQPSGWSEPARWSMGLLAPEDWRAKWIGYDEPPKPDDANPLVQAKSQWIWFPGEKGAQAGPVATRYFRRVFDLPADRVVVRGELILAADNQFATAVNGKHAGSGSSFKSGVVMNVTKSLRPGGNAVAGWVKNLGDDPNPAGLVGVLRVEFETGDPLVIPTDATWKVFSEDVSRWTVFEFDDSAWSTAEVVGPVGCAPWGEISVNDEDRRLAARMLRKGFHLANPKPMARATVYFSGLGLSELYINGEKIGDQVLSPGLTDYTKRVHYLTFDVTEKLNRRTNAIGVWLGNGRFYAPRAQSPMTMEGYGYPKLLFQLAIDYQDGSRQLVVSDETWKLTADGPIQANNEFDGEEYDARKEMPGWCSPGFDDGNWQDAQLVAAPGGPLVAEMIEPIRVTETVKPVKITEPEPGMFIFDMGQNMVGWCRLKVQGEAGTTVKLRHAETLKEDGTLYLDNIRGAKVTDLYTLKGQGTEVYEPRFTYHGFRFVEVTGFPGRPTLDAIEGCVVHDDLETAGLFECSQPMINRIYRNIVWGVRGNYRSIPTDCPQRDERQGWLGDRSAESKGETFLFKNAALYSKWVQDMADAQKESGSVPDVCPAYWPIYSDNVTWPSSLVIIPGSLLDQFGDTKTIALAYPHMVRWIDYMSQFIADDIMPRDRYGDWCVPPEDPKLIHSQDPARKTAGPILGTTYFYHCLTLMTRYATLLDKPDDAQRFTALAERLKAGLNKTYFKSELGQYDNGAQTTSVLPLAFGMVPDNQRQPVFDHLVRKITDETNRHVGTGLVGGQWLNRVLTDGGRADLSYGFATNTSYPSWGYMVENGATTIWELWNGDTADPAMNSGNHVMLVGDLVIWLYECVAGIQSDPEEPGFKHILMRPHPVGDLRWVKAWHESPYGKIESAWKVEGSAFTWDVTIPPGTSATVWVPASAGADVKESGKPIGEAEGVRLVRREGDSTVLAVGSGAYRFESTLAR
ncbi:MAG: family 78 glycoside hydrolase catalytic domain [Planctomycetaceae bacterium]|nr:family 78 glycoside hydrolase catalytic domain [Planctomycetaceae bacterium]